MNKMTNIIIIIILIEIKIIIMIKKISKNYNYVFFVFDFFFFFKKPKKFKYFFTRKNWILKNPKAHVLVEKSSSRGGGGGLHEGKRRKGGGRDFGRRKVLSEVLPSTFDFRLPSLTHCVPPLAVPSIICSTFALSHCASHCGRVPLSVPIFTIDACVCHVLGLVLCVRTPFSILVALRPCICGFALCCDFVLGNSIFPSFFVVVRWCNFINICWIMGRQVLRTFYPAILPRDTFP